ncbi:hypothetical protein D9758_006563 [Tetrapyrgos nigripes]|uniref:Uncharacterized protein n=1 Tax=Tetrapyrgos nigripes TaxID=182062 RepID=A0A8H5GL62_9AGAR|nr:hypothetical protein D9758_006563 [Tetrapyrgos nigripes]
MKRPSVQITVDIDFFDDSDILVDAARLCSTQRWHVSSDDEDFREPPDRLQASIEAIQQQVVSYQLQISKLQECISVIEQQKDLAMHSLQMKHSLLQRRCSPIRRLPFELLEEILALCCHFQEDALFERFSIQTHQESIWDALQRNGIRGCISLPFLNLSHSCSYWKIIAPRAWRNIRILLNDRTSWGTVHLLSQHLSMLNDLSIRVDITHNESFGPFSPILSTAFNMVLDRAQQWTAANLHLTVGNFETLAKRIAGAIDIGPLFDRLHTLSLEVCSLVSPHAQTVICESSQAFRSAMNLRRLSLCVHDSMNARKLSGLSFGRLTSLSLPLRQLDHLSVLQLCTELEALRLDLGMLRAKPRDPSSAVDVTEGLPSNLYTSNISHLILTSVGIPALMAARSTFLTMPSQAEESESPEQEIFRILHLPNLESLDIQPPRRYHFQTHMDMILLASISQSGHSDHLKIPLRLLTTLLSQSPPPPLRKVSISSPMEPVLAFNQTDFVEALYLAPQLTHLSIPVWGNLQSGGLEFRELLGRLILTGPWAVDVDAPGPFLPSLSELELSIEKGEDFLLLLHLLAFIIDFCSQPSSVHSLRTGFTLRVKVPLHFYRPDSVEVILRRIPGLESPGEERRVEVEGISMM